MLRAESGIGVYGKYTIGGKLVVNKSQSRTYHPETAKKIFKYSSKTSNIPMHVAKRIAIPIARRTFDHS